MTSQLERDITQKGNEDRIITIGNKNDEIYITTILHKLISYSHVYIKVMAFPEKLAKVNYYYSILVNFGIARLENPVKMTEQSNKGDGKIEVVVFKWEVIPRLMKWRESLKDNEFLTLGIE